MVADTKCISIKNQTPYFFNDIINIKNFDSKLLEIDKKSCKDIDIYYIGYITIKKIDHYENVHTVNLLYLIIHSATGHFKKKNDEKYLILDLTDKFEEFWSGIEWEVKIRNGGKELFYGKNYSRIEISSDDSLPLKKQIKFPTLTIIFRFVFQEGEKLYPQIYLEECLYEL